MTNCIPATRWQTFPRRRLRGIVFASAIAVVTLVLGRSAALGDTPQYNRDIRPILADNCFACHGSDSAGREADLRLDQRDAAIEAGAITPGETDDSELITRILSDDPDIVMPPPETKKSLSTEQKQLLKRWVAAGAEYQQHWSLIVPSRPELPNVEKSSWPKNAIDRFVLAMLEANGLAPAAAADAHTLFRRLHLDITGLPPDSQDVVKFVDEYGQHGDEALSKWIDRLMASTAWGEHRSRYWLDAARYGDTHGLHYDNYREIWVYRDWVIRAFNSNQPFDQFTVEQLAGDLLPNPTNDQLIATGFQRCNITTNEGGTIDEENLANYAADRVQTFGWVYLGLTTNCCQCHDHKFDPITMHDYYSLAAYFRNTTQRAKDGNAKDGKGPVVRVPSGVDKPRWEALPQEIAAAVVKRDARKKDALADFENWQVSTTSTSVTEGVAPEDLVIHLPLNEGEGNVVRSGEAASNAYTSSGDISWIEGGKFGSAPILKAGSTFDLGDVGDFELSQPFSYGAWVRTARNRAASGIIARMDEEAAHRGWDLYQDVGSYAAHILDSWPDNGLKVVTRSAVVKPKSWQHVFVTYDGSGTAGGIKIYVDGIAEPLKIERDKFDPNASIRTKVPLRIGQRNSSAVFDGGSLQDLRVYKRQLDAGEVRAIAENPILALSAIPVGERTKQQQTELFEYYLAARDAEFPRLAKAVADLEDERKTILARSPVTHIQRERANSPAMAHILMRGAYDKPGEKVNATTPAALHPLPSDASQDRLGLARWVVDPANPLTARVTVNRFWQEIFGQGIVATPENFGVMGAPPSHPELLDWLALEFRGDGWNVKKLFKRILMSATYRQAAITTPDKLEKDRDNILLSRGPRFRMDAEMVRDYALATSGLLSAKMYGPGTRPYQPDGIWDIVGLPGGDTRNYVQDKGENLYRRTIYTFLKRMAPPPNLDAFNAPSREVCTVRRERTNTPLQALVTLNDPQFVEAARNLAQIALSASGGDVAKTIDTIAQRVLCRAMSEREQAIALASSQELLDYYKSNLDNAKALITVGDSTPDDKIDVAELAAWTMVCNQIMNLDEVLTK